MKKVILTFDDGPSENFQKLLEYLIKNKYKAIFFCLGKNLEFPERKKQIIKAIKKGFLIGNHSYSHRNFNMLSFKKAKEEILKTDKLIEEIYKEAKIKRPIKLFRFPYLRRGLLNYFRIQKFLKKLNYKDILNSWRYDVGCSLSTKDWNKKTTKEFAIKRIQDAGGGEIIGLHDQEHSRNNLLIPICEFLSSKNLI